MNAADADTESTLTARLAELLGPLTEGPHADAVRAELDRLAAAPLPTLGTEHPAPPLGPTADQDRPHLSNGHSSHASRTADAVSPC